jgi:SAM-dependent methyltransferase
VLRYDADVCREEADATIVACAGRRCPRCDNDLDRYPARNPEKDFGPIADDYAFFENHATEAEQDARAYLDRLRDVVPSEGVLRMLDFGCGTGTFTAQFLQRAGWPPERLQLTLVDPVESALMV